MSKPLLMDLRERLTSVVEGGMSRRLAAKLFSIGSSTMIKWVDQQRWTGSVRPHAHDDDYRSHVLATHADEIASFANDTGLTLAALAEHLEKTQNLKVVPSTIRRLLDRQYMAY